jgi:hypothetical protein
MNIGTRTIGADVFETGVVVMEAATQIFSDCEASSDFCIQTVGSVVVFGGTNRLCFSPFKGFYLDEKFCTENFIRKFNELTYLK